MKTLPIVLKMVVLCCLASLCGCKPKDELGAAMRDLASGDFYKMKRAQMRLIPFCKQDPGAVRRTIKAQNNPMAWALAISCAGEAHPKLFAELLLDVTETDVPLGIAVKYVESPALQKLSSEERQVIQQKYESRLGSITSPEQKEKVEKFLRQLADAETPVQ